MEDKCRVRHEGELMHCTHTVAISAMEEDFTPLDIDLTILTAASECQEIAVREDGVVENVEGFQVSLTSSDEAVVIVSGQETVNINDTTGECIRGA